MKSFRNAALVAAGGFILAASGAYAAPAPFNWLAGTAASSSAVAPQQRILSGINESNLIRLAGNTRAEAIADNDLGKVVDSLLMDHMQLLLQRSPEQEQALKQYIDDETNPKSPNFHKWLTAAELGDKYGASQTDITTVTGWLQGHGFTVNTVYRNNMVIDFTGTAGQVAQAFHTEIHNLNVDGVAHFANMSDPKIPAALSSVVAGVASLHNFMPHTNFKTRTQSMAARGQLGPEYGPDYTSGSSNFPYVVVPADLATIYNLNPLFAAGFTGAGQTIGIIEDTDGGTNVVADFNLFRSTFGLPATTLTTAHPASSGTNNCSDPGIVSLAEGEAQLDVEWAGASAPGATIVMETCRDSATTFGGLLAVQNLVNSGNPPKIMSISYGECEPRNGATQNALYNTVYQQAAAAGVSLFVSSGDESSVSCDPNASAAAHGIAASGFTTTPYNVSVGGTDFEDTLNGTNSTYWAATNSATYGSALSYIPEIPWNDSCASQLLMNYEFAKGATTTSNTYGAGSLCAQGQALSTGSGSGAPSNCYSGAPSVAGVASGTCAGQPKPSWQAGFIGNPADGVRDIPDVSLFSSNGWWGHYYVFCDSDTADKNAGNQVCSGQQPINWSGAGGTSFASPIMAGIQALVNQSAGGAQGLPNPAYYTIAAAEYGASGSSACNSSVSGGPASSCVFYDVTQGDMNVNCITLTTGVGKNKTTVGTFNCFLDGQTNGVGSLSDTSFSPIYGTNAGWDFSTGIGTVNGYNLVAAYTGATGLGVTASGSSLVLNWTAPYDPASSYNIYEGTTAGGEGATPVLTGVTGTTATVSGLAPGTYYFTVAAVNASTGATSVKSVEASGTAVATTLSAPTNVTASATSSTSITLNWTAGSGAKSYAVYEGTSPACCTGAPVVKGITGTTTVISGLTPLTTYYFRVTSVSAPNQSAMSNIARATTLPTPPTVTLALSQQVIAKGGSSTLSWSSTGAVSCSASGTWSGAQNTSGTLNVTQNTAGKYPYTLTCTNLGGSAAQTVNLLVGK